MKEKKSLLDRWAEWLGMRAKSRPSNEYSYGKGVDKVTMRLPRNVEEQFKMVNVMQVLDQFPNDYKLKLEFFNMIAPYGSIMNQPVTMELLQYDGVETYISLYADLLLRPLSQGAATKLQATMTEILPAMTESTK